ncbi:MAG: hypothetical protein ACRCS9_04845 [Hyphomicrobium sp.]
MSLKVSTRGVIASAVLAGSLALGGAARAEDVKFDGVVSDIFGHRVVVDAGAKKHLVNFGPKIKDVGTLKAGDKVTVEGDLKKSGEVRAHNLTLADGKVIVLGKDKQSWKEWLLGDDEDDKPFKAADAKTLATSKGYTLAGEPVAEKKHFVAEAKKDGKDVVVRIHRDGGIEEKAPFKIDEAKAVIKTKGYDLVQDPTPVKEHFEALARKDGKYFEVHAHRDGEFKEVRVVDKADARWGAYIP